MANADDPEPKRDDREQLTGRDGVIGLAHGAQLAQAGGPVAHTVAQATGVVDAAKIASDVARGKEVRGVDVASAAASVTMTTGLGGFAVQLGAQAVAAISAADAGQRALNTVEAKLHEPRAADVDARKTIERGNDEMQPVPVDALDAQTARLVAREDIAALRTIEDPRERHAAAVAMGHNAQSQSHYKAELGRQDTHLAEVVALAWAKQKQATAAKEDRKAPEVAVASDSPAPKNSIEYVSARELEAIARAARHRADPKAERPVERMLPPRDATPLEDRFNVVQRFARGRDYYFRDQPGKVAFKERWLSLQSSVDTPAVVKAMVDRAQERGWEAIRIKGSEEFQRQAWIAATARGIKAVGYEPTAGDRVAATEERARLAAVQDPSLVRASGNTKRQSAPERSDSPDRPKEAPSSAERSVERAAKRATVQKPIEAPMRRLLIERGDSPGEIEAIVAIARDRMSGDRVHVGQLVAHGRDHFEFDKTKEPSYYVKLKSPAGEKVVWGVDLPRALEEGQLKVGDSVALEHRGIQPVTVVVKDRDTSGKVVGQHEEEVRRNTWYAVNIEQLRREAVPSEPDHAQMLHTRESARESMPTSPAADRPSASPAPNKQPNIRDAAILQKLEEALELKHVPPELRAEVRAELRKELDVRLATGRPVKVAIYDPAAPSREPQRAVQIARSRRAEQERSR